MTDDVRASIEPLHPRSARPSNQLSATLPVGSFTTSLLLDVLTLIADNPAQRESYERRAADMLRRGMNGTLLSTALEISDFLRAPAGGGDAGRFALNGAMIAVYLLDVAAREGGGVRRGFGAVLPTGLSLIGLALLAIAKRV